MWLVHNHGSVLSVGKPPSAHCPSENLLLFSKRGERMECSRPHHLNASNNEEETSLSWAQRRAAITAIQTTTNNVTVTLDRVGEKLLTSDLNSILRYFGRLRRWEDICQLLSACTKMRDGYSKAWDFLKDLKGKGLKLDAVMYGSLLAICAANDRDEEAEAFFQQMKNERLSANEFHYSSLLNAYAAKGKYEEAEKLVDEMKSSGIVPNKVVLNSLIKVYVKSGHFGKAKKVLAELDASGHISIERPYCTVMHGLAKAGKIGEAQKVFNEMKAKGIKSDGYSYSVMISSYSKTGNFEKYKLLKTCKLKGINQQRNYVHHLLQDYEKVERLKKL